MTEVVVTTGAVRCAKLQSNYHHQQTNTQLFMGRMLLLLPNQQCQSTEGKGDVGKGIPPKFFIASEYAQHVVFRRLSYPTP